MQSLFAYSSENPSIKDFVIELFKSCYALAMEEEVSLTQDALVIYLNCRLLHILYIPLADPK